MGSGAGLDSISSPKELTLTLHGVFLSLTSPVLHEKGRQPGHSQDSKDLEEEKRKLHVLQRLPFRRCMTSPVAFFPQSKSRGQGAPWGELRQSPIAEMQGRGACAPRPCDLLIPSLEACFAPSSPHPHPHLSPIPLATSSLYLGVCVFLWLLLHRLPEESPAPWDLLVLLSALSQTEVVPATQARNMSFLQSSGVVTFSLKYLPSLFIPHPCS